MTNADKAQGEVRIDLFGEEKVLIFNTLAFCVVEEVTGIDVLAGDLWRKMSATNLSAFLWAGLRGGGFEMSLEEFRKKVSIAELKGFRASIEEGMRQATPPEKKSDEPVTGSEPSESPQTGLSSGPSDATTSA